MTRKRKGTPRRVEPKDYREDFKIQFETGAPELTRILFAREPGVVPSEDYEYELKFNAGVVRPHARHLILELSAVITAIPWAQGGRMLVSYQIYYLMRGKTSAAATEAISLDVARRIGPAALYPFIRETVQTTTAKAGSAITLPMIDWGAAFPQDMEIPAPLGETPPEFLEPVG